MVGEEGRGVRTIIDMVAGTRLDCTNWAAALMRQAVTQAGWHVAHRSAFGATLIDKPLMQNVLADLEIETEAATLLVGRLSGAFERAPADPGEAALARIGAAVAKYWVTKRSTPVVREALECVGGNGYVEESILPRLYREAPLNSIWEGSGNVIALDVLRALARSPEAATRSSPNSNVEQAADPRVDHHIEQVRTALGGPPGDEADARRLVELLAVTWTASLLVQHGDQDVTDTYLRSRLDGDWGQRVRHPAQRRTPQSNRRTGRSAQLRARPALVDGPTRTMAPQRATSARSMAVARHPTRQRGRPLDNHPLRIRTAPPENGTYALGRPPHNARLAERRGMPPIAGSQESAKMVPCLPLSRLALSATDRKLAVPAIRMATSSFAPNARRTPSSSLRSRTRSGSRPDLRASQPTGPPRRHSPDRPLRSARLPDRERGHRARHRVVLIALDPAFGGRSRPDCPNGFVIRPHHSSKSAATSD